MNEHLFSAWISTEHFSKCNTYSYKLIPYYDLTWDEVMSLMKLSLVRGHECIIIRESETDGDED